ncbi:hypothetical protein [Desulfosediminicola sp.]|uniref:hypothetical protein n=1 Tax=Desulfosediminicola sp. TaxID=2886825 RepID=UPI003AF315B4
MMLDFKYSFKGLVSKLVREGASFQKCCDYLNKTQWFDEKQLNDLMCEQLSKIVKHATLNITYYKKSIYKNILDGNNNINLDYFQDVPFLSKEHLYKFSDELRLPKWKCPIYSASKTSGTTGKPLTLYRDIYSVNFEHATIFRQWSWAGYRVGDSFATIRGELISRNTSPPVFWAYNKIQNELIMSSFHISDSTIKGYIKTLISFKPKFIYCYPQSIFTILKYAKEKKIDLQSMRVKAVFTSSETVSSELRNMVKEQLGCLIFDYYNMAERVMPIATCEKGNYHLLEDYGYAEFYPVENTESKYELIGSGFLNKKMPLIRYRTGDVVELLPDKEDRECECGRRFRQVKSIVGRPTNYIIGKNNRQISEAGLTHIFYGEDLPIFESQIIQNQLEEIIIRVVPLDDFETFHADKLINAIQNYTGIYPLIEKVDKIDRTKAGKFQFVKRYVNL